MYLSKVLEQAPLSSILEKIQVLLHEFAIFQSVICSLQCSMVSLNLYCQQHICHWVLHFTVKYMCIIMKLCSSAAMKWKEKIKFVLLHNISKVFLVMQDCCNSCAVTFFFFNSHFYYASCKSTFSIIICSRKDLGRNTHWCRTVLVIIT
jgi:hypothetical protein